MGAILEKERQTGRSLCSIKVNRNEFKRENYPFRLYETTKTTFNASSQDNNKTGKLHARIHPLQ